MTVTSIANHKGGVGKSFVTTLLAAELAAAGRKVLVIDLDPQANLSRRVGYSEEQLGRRPSMAEAVQQATPEALRATLLPCQWEPDWSANITLAPSRIELENRVPEAGVPGAWRRLARALPEVAVDYDDVLIDTPPTLGHLLHLALVASDLVIAPTTPEYDGVRAVHRLADFVNGAEQRDSLGMRARLAGIIINARRARVAVHEDRTAQIRQTWPDLVWEPSIPLRAGMAEAGELAEPPQSADGPAGLVIRAAAAELARRYVAEAQPVEAGR